MASKLIIDIGPDGSIKSNARGLAGSEEQIMQLLEELAKDVGGELTVEKHEPGAHVHTHSDSLLHNHGGGGGWHKH